MVDIPIRSGSGIYKREDAEMITLFKLKHRQETAPRAMFATVSAAVDEVLFNWMRKELKELQYGEIGLHVTVHAGKVVRHRKILEVVGKPVESVEKAGGNGS